MRLIIIILMIPGLCYSQIADTVCGVGIANIDTIITANIDTVYGVAWYRCGNSTITHGGVTYNIVQIGNQCWFKENLNYGSRINGSSSQTDNESAEKYCYSNTDGACTTYGGLYQWDEAMQYVTTEGAQGLCPTGWHIPTDAEFTILTNFLEGEAEAGGKMKHAGTTYWWDPNTGADNSSGFTALPAGGFIPTATWHDIGYTAGFWTSSLNSTMIYYRNLTYNSDDVLRENNGNKTHAVSIRCIKN